MAQNFVQTGDVIDHVAAAILTSGTPILIGSIVGVPLADAAIGETVSVALEGVFTLPKATGTAWAIGDKLYWDDTAKKFTKTSGSNTPSGYAAAAAASGDATGNVLLEHVSGTMAANVADIATADGSDAGTTQTLANDTKAKVNEILAALKAAGLMVAD